MAEFARKNIGYIISAFVYLCLAQAILGLCLIANYNFNDSPTLVAVTGVSAGVAVTAFGVVIGLLFSGFCDILSGWNNIYTQMHGGNLAFCLAISYLVLLPYGGPTTCLCAALVYVPFIIFALSYDTNTAFRSIVNARCRQLGFNP